jgi:hypothetical protein
MPKPKTLPKPKSSPPIVEVKEDHSIRVEPFTNDHFYKVNSYGQTFRRCRIIGHAQLTANMKAWQFESLDTETYGMKFFCHFRKCITKIED